MTNPIFKQTIKDFKDYLDFVEKLSEELDEKQQQELNTIFETLLILIIAFKKGSNLGNDSYLFFLTKRDLGQIDLE